MKVQSVLLLLSMILISSCSINQMATKAVADALTGSGSSEVFTGDADPELVGDAMPFAIKMYEALLSQQPRHQGLIITTGSLFIMYANAFIQGPAQRLPPSRFAEREPALERAKKLYLRGADILTAGLDRKYPGFSTAYQEGNQNAYLAKMKKEDVPSLYWITAGVLSAYSLNPFDMDQGVRLPEVTAFIHRAYELDPDFNNGAIDEFYLLFYAALPPSLGGDKSKVDTHFNLALKKSQGRLASPYVSYAEAVCIPAQDYDTFKTYLETAVALDVEADPANRLVNILAQRKARYLLDMASNYFFDLDPGDWGDEEGEEE
ncbi:MAG: TRAP transporter TatT component family protein [Treponema sp.]|jgi:predicted anti-sigma-YlaC factor YlaD|nr:TRAP transporter TatT component family protein [Treponema sp.]